MYPIYSILPHPTKYNFRIMHLSKMDINHATFFSNRLGIIPYLNFETFKWADCHCDPMVNEIDLSKVGDTTTLSFVYQFETYCGLLNSFKSMSYCNFSILFVSSHFHKKIVDAKFY